MDTLGLVESRSIAAGAVLTDAMVKAADVTLVKAGPICSGRYLIYISGDRDAVATSVAAAESSGFGLAGSCSISNISPDVVSALKGHRGAAAGMAMGVVESKTATPGIKAADAAVKRSLATLARLSVASGINGKCFFVLAGDVASVEEGVNAARESLGPKCIEAVVIPSPDACVLKAFVK